MSVTLDSDPTIPSPVKNVQPDNPSHNYSTDLFAQISAMGHENVVFCHDEATGLKAIIAIHSTVLGPALGGTRFWNYQDESDAITDVLRLSRGMTFKAAISGVNLGGGKAVILGDSQKDGSETFWRRYGRFVDGLDGKYITAEDVGTKIQDMEYIAMETESVTGKPAWLGGGGDPSPVTAYGVFLGLKAGLKQATGSDELSNRSVVVQGVGSVGSSLVEQLCAEGATVYVSDIHEASIARCVNEFGAKAIDLDEVYSMEADVYAPCALGATLNDKTIPELRCSVVAGAANNQLLDEQKHGKMLQERGIVYAPDFLINAGGLINCYEEYLGAYDRKHALEMTEYIYNRTLEIFAAAAESGQTSQQAAINLANERINAMVQLKSRL